MHKEKNREHQPGLHNLDGRKQMLPVLFRYELFLTSVFLNYASSRKTIAPQLFRQSVPSFSRVLSVPSGALSSFVRRTV